VVKLTTVGDVIKPGSLAGDRNLVGVYVRANAVNLGVNHGQRNRGTSRAASKIQNAMNLVLHVWLKTRDEVFQMMVHDS
jgi:hypothetical protein